MIRPPKTFVKMVQKECPESCQTWSGKTLKNSPEAYSPEAQMIGREASKWLSGASFKDVKAKSRRILAFYVKLSH